MTLLRAAGCNLVQGYLFGRPGSVEAHASFMARNDPRPAMAHTRTPAAAAQETADAQAEASGDEQDGQAQPPASATG